MIKEDCEKIISKETPHEPNLFLHPLNLKKNYSKDLGFLKCKTTVLT